MAVAYTFIGITKFVETAAAELGLTCLEQIHRAKSGWHLKTVVDALSQLPAMAENARAGRISADAPAEALKRVKLVRDALAVQLAALDAAIKDVVEGLGLEPTPADSGSKADDSGNKADDSGSKPTPVTPTPVVTPPVATQPTKAAAKK